MIFLNAATYFIKRLIVLFAVIISVLFSIALQGCSRTYFYEVEGTWSCDILSITSYGKQWSSDPTKYPVGTLILDGKEYQLTVSFRDDEARFCDAANPQSIEGNIWDVITDLKEDKLIVKVARDFKSNCKGNTYVLEKVDDGQ